MIKLPGLRPPSQLSVHDPDARCASTVPSTTAGATAPSHHAAPGDTLAGCIGGGGGRFLHLTDRRPVGKMEGLCLRRRWKHV